jgi:hypothetical protein
LLLIGHRRPGMQTITIGIQSIAELREEMRAGVNDR